MAPPTEGRNTNLDRNTCVPLLALRSSKMPWKTPVSHAQFSHNIAISPRCHLGRVLGRTWKAGVMETELCVWSYRTDSRSHFCLLTHTHTHTHSIAHSPTSNLIADPKQQALELNTFSRCVLLRFIISFLCTRLTCVCFLYKPSPLLWLIWVMLQVMLSLFLLLLLRACFNLLCRFPKAVLPLLLITSFPFW